MVGRYSLQCLQGQAVNIQWARDQEERLLSDRGIGDWMVGDRRGKRIPLDLVMGVIDESE